MINALSQRISKYLYKNSMITADDIELYTYGFFVLLSRVLFLIISTIFGVIFNIATESIVFYILFCFIRSYAGGIHASTELLCTVFTTVSLFLSVLSIKLMLNYSKPEIAFLVYLISLVIVITLSPLDTKEKPLSDNEKKYFKLKTYVVFIVISLILIIAIFVQKNNFFYAGLMSLVLESILLISGKIKFTAVIKKDIVMPVKMRKLQFIKTKPSLKKSKKIIKTSKSS